MSAFTALVRKDIQLYLLDRRALVMSLLAPILIAAFFGFLFGGTGSSGKPARTAIAVTDLDGSAISQAIVAGLQADEALSVQLLEGDAAVALVKKGKLRAALQLPKGFGEQAARALFGAGSKPELVLTHDPSQAAVLGLVRGLVTQQVMQAVSQQAFSPSSGSFADLRRMAESAPEAQRGDLKALFDSVERVQASAPASSAASGTAGGLQQPFALRLVEGSSSPTQGYNAYAHSFAGMGVQFILMLGVDIGIGLLLMRRMDLWKRLRAAPVSRATLLGSRMVSTALIAFVLFATIMLAGMLFFGVRVLGSWLGFAMVMAAFALLTASFGLMIAALGRTPEATRGLAIVATLLMVMLGGAWVPSFIFPEWLQTATLVVPTRWAVDGLDAMTWRGQGLEDALAPTAVLLGFALLFALIAWWRFRWEE